MGTFSSRSTYSVDLESAPAFGFGDRDRGSLRWAFRFGHRDGKPPNPVSDWGSRGREALRRAFRFGSHDGKPARPGPQPGGRLRGSLGRAFGFLDREGMAPGATFRRRNRDGEVRDRAFGF